MNLAQLLEINGKQLDSYQTKQTYGDCHMTVEVFAIYHCLNYNRNEHWLFKLYYWRMPAQQHGVINIRLSSFEKYALP